MKTYEITSNGAAIRCLICGLTSFHPNDMQSRYCGHCHKFHADMERELIKTDIDGATHVQTKDGPIEKITSKWGIGPGNRLAKPSEGGFGCITETGKRIDMWSAWAYYKFSEE